MSFDPRPFKSFKGIGPLLKNIRQGDEVAAVGRLAGFFSDTFRWLLQDATGKVLIRLPDHYQLRPGQIIRVKGRFAENEIIASECEAMPGALPGPGEFSGSPERYILQPESAGSYMFLEEMIRKVRTWLAERGYSEVDTPYLYSSPGTDLNIEAFETLYTPGMDALMPEQTLYLHTSPELAMKRLLVAGFPAIFQTSRVFRNGEVSNIHRPEFMMAEWYRVGISYMELMDEIEEMLAELFMFKTPIPRITIAELFRENLGIDPLAPDSRDRFAGYLLEKGHDRDLSEDSWEDLFYRLIVECIEPSLSSIPAIFVYDYPAPLAILARVKQDDKRVAERFELYLSGMEIANGFSELTDLEEQTRRFEKDLEKRKKLGRKLYPMPQAFLKSLEIGLPPCAGVSLGLDRLAMVLSGKKDLSEILPFS